MSKILISLLFIFLSSVNFKALALPTFSANDDGTISVFADPDEYESQGDDVWSAMQTKRFWSPHPSDYNPLRRPLPVPRGSKRDEINVPYHPIPRGVSMKQRSLGQGGEYSDNYDQYLEGGRQKKQTRATTLIFRLGSWGLRRKPADKNAPATPSSNSS